MPYWPARLPMQEQDPTLHRPTPALALQADLLDFTAAPAWGDTRSPAVRWRPAHWLLLGVDGRIAAVQPETPPPGVPRVQHPGRLLLPGFIDSHVHAPQIAVLASHGTALLDWLARHTFPSELGWADEAVARRGSELFLDALLAHGSTSAAVFATVHKHSAEALFEGAAARGMALATGKVLMDRHAPPGLCDASVATSERESIDLIQRWHRRGRAHYAVTVRFAPTSTPEQLAMAGALCRGDASLYQQTHLSENRDELRWVAELFPDATRYLDVYDRVGLVHPRALLAHGIWLDTHDHARLHERGATVVHCPTSNLFLGSGLFDWQPTAAAGVGVTLASDVGGGTSLNLLRNAAAAATVQALQGRRLTAWTALHAATRGAAQALHWGHEVGTLEPGQFADFTLWDRSIGAVDGERQRVAARSGDLHEAIYAWMTLADERHLAQTWVAGQRRYSRDGRGA
jgi:guanine deaminase